MMMQSVDTYLAVRRALGYKLDATERHLRSFVQFASAQGDVYTKAQTAIAWAGQARSENQRFNRLQAVIKFAQFCHAEDDRHEIPSDQVFCSQRQRPAPYIFTDHELRNLIVQAAQLGPPGSLRPQTYSTLFGLLAATGLRISEALALRFQYVTDDGLVIRESKFRKSRLVPLHPTTTAALEQYLKRRCELAIEDDHLFVSRRRRPLSRTVVYQTFYQLLTAAGIPAVPGRRRPRLIDMRHSFATKALLRCPEGRDQVGHHMLALSTYLGHAHVSSTFWYLESTPQLLSDIAQACEQFIDGGTS